MVLASYVWTCWRYESASATKDYSIRFRLAKGEWPPAQSEYEDAVNTTLYKTVLMRLMSSTPNESESLVFQTSLVLLPAAQLVELSLIRPHLASSLVYCTCVNSILVIVFGLSLAGAAVTTARLSCKSWSLSSRCGLVTKLHCCIEKLWFNMRCVLLSSKH